MKRFFLAGSVAAMIAATAIISVRAAGLPACDPDNGGLKLPQGFCALVAADDVGAARHMVVMPNGDLYVTTQGSQGHPAGVVGLRDTNGDGKMDVTERFGDKSTTGIAARNGMLVPSWKYSLVPNTMTFRGPQVPPRPLAADATVCGSPPAISVRISL